MLAAALETAFDPAQSLACIDLGQTARDAAAGWLPPGMPYDNASADARPDRIDHAAPDNAAPDCVDPAAAELPAFLTEDKLRVRGPEPTPPSVRRPGAVVSGWRHPADPS